MSGGAADARTAAVRAALRAPDGEPLARVMHAPTVTALVADAADAGALGAVLPPLLDALAAAGVPRGRAFVLLAGSGDAARDRQAARALREALGIPVIAHDPGRSASFVIGRTSAGVAVELDDELREAEAVVVLASVTAANAAGRAAALVWPGLAPSAAARAHADRPPAARAQAAHEAAALLGVDFGLAWWDGDAPRAWAGEKDRAFEAAAGALTVLDPPRGRT